MKIGILGAGNVGSALGRKWIEAGHEVRYGVRSPKPGEALETSVAEAARFGEVVVLATPWPATREALAAAGDLGGKIVVDCTNPLRPALDGLEIGTDRSGAELVAGWAPGARVVKAFNTVGFNIMADPGFGDRNATLLYCGDDASAKAAVHRLAAECGFEPVDAGPLTQARLLEPFALLWITLALKYGMGREFVFQLLRR